LRLLINERDDDDDALRALQPANFVTLTRVTNNASRNWVNLVHVTSVQFSSSAVNTAFETLFGQSYTF